MLDISICVRRLLLCGRLVFGKVGLGFLPRYVNRSVAGNIGKNMVVCHLLWRVLELQLVVSESRTVRDGRRALVKDPPVAQADAELVDYLGTGLAGNLLGKDMLTIFTGGAFHLLGLPFWLRERASNEEWRLGTG